MSSGSVNEWDSGSINPSVGVSITNSGTLTLNGSGDVVLGGNGTLVNNGTINQTNLGNLQLAGAGNQAMTLNNAATGNSDFQTDSGISGSTSGTVNNAGLLEKTAGTMTSQIAVDLTSTGTLDAASGILQINATSTNSGGTYTTASGPRST
jgi:hypothetical protein